MEKANRYRVMGWFLVMLGGALLLVQLDVLPNTVHAVVFSWRGLLTLLGILSLAKEENWVPGTVMLVAGSFFMVAEVVESQLGYVLLDWALFWPMAAILFGGLTLVRAVNHLMVKG